MIYLPQFQNLSKQIGNPFTRRVLGVGTVNLHVVIMPPTIE